MIKRVLRRSMREPIPCIAAILFAAILAVILCFLHLSQEEEIQDLTNTYYNTPITFEVTWLDGTRLHDSTPASGHFADLLPGLFLGNGRYQSEMKDMIKDLEIRMQIFGWEPGSEPVEGSEPVDRIMSWNMVGITSLDAAKDQSSTFQEIIEEEEDADKEMSDTDQPPEFRDIIEWEEGYDESIFLTDQFVCIAPAIYEGPEDEVALTFSWLREYTFTFKIVGRYTEKNNDNMYCPYRAMEQVYARLSMPKAVERLSGRLKNNDDLELFREAAAEWFATPNPGGEPTPWDNPFGYESYPLAMDIDDSQLEGLMKEMEKSITINRVAATLVFVLSAGAGFLTGFLVIRSRKREIALMRTLGTSNATVCMELEMEQILCVAAGVIIGGSYSLWEPVGRLCIFAGVYIAGLSMALLVFMRTNLLATMKEDE